MNDRAPDSFFLKGGEDVEGRGRRKWIGHGRDGVVRKRKLATSVANRPVASCGSG
jgi:hypothetical protein